MSIIVLYRRTFMVAALLLGLAGAAACSTLLNDSAPPVTAQLRLIAPDNPQIRYTGRVAVSPSAALYDWANIQIEFHVRAPQIDVLLDDSKNDYNLFIDGEFQKVISTTDAKAYPITLGEGAHQIKLSKRTGPNFGSGSFLGLRLPEGGQLLDLPPEPIRKIEFIGDSYTVGYGNEGPSLDCGDVYRPYENSALSYASIAAEEMDAQSHLIAISGYGAVRNYADPNTTSATPVPFYHARTLMEREDLPWDFQRWIPDAVVVKLGTNDHSTQPEPPAEIFIAGVHGLLRQVHEAYGEVPVFLLADTSLPQLVERMQIATQQQREAGNHNTHFVRLSHPPKAQRGCDWHPLVVAHKTMAAELVAAMKPIMGW